MPTNGPGEVEIDDLAVAVYRLVLRDGVFVPDRAATELAVCLEELERARKGLLDLGLLAELSDGGPLVAVNPEIAESELSAPLERDIAERRRALNSIHRQMRVLAPVYSTHHSHRPTDSGFRLVGEQTDVVRELTAAARQCADQVLTMQPGGGRNAETLRSALERDLQMMERGVSMRILYQHTARASLATRAYVRQVSEAGAEVRTTGEIAERLIVFDRRIAFIPWHRPERRTPGAAIVEEPTVVTFLCRMHESAWLSAQPFEPDRVEYEQAADTLQASILRLMAQGLKDAVIARRMGMATRTCRRYIAAIMEDLGATSRFQGGVRATQLGLLAPGGLQDDGQDKDDDEVPGDFDDDEE
ncbi:MAG TPA: helix-turn-helix transcriptional regulator [Rugosimonospora sp.]|nr:helix-turn-helix transcriptional regulator [Rugosimonospora sp.]